MSNEMVAAEDSSQKEKAPLHVQVRRQLQTKISRMKVGEKLPAERALSEQFQVDRVTIRRAMLDLEKEGYVLRHQGRGTFINKIVSQDSHHATGTKTICVILPDLELPQFTATLKGIEEEAAKHDCQIWIRNALLDMQREREILRSLEKEELVGIITCPFYDSPLDPNYVALLNQIIAGGRKIVLIDQYVPGVDAAVATTDKVQEGYLPTEHLIMRGHRRICLVSTHTFDTSGNDAYRGYRQALEDYNVPFDPELVINIPVQESATPSYDAITRLLSDKPNICSAIITPQFTMGYSIYKALLALGRKVGGDIALIGNNMMWNPECKHVTSVYEPFDEVGKAAISLMLRDPSQEAGYKRHAMIAPKLILGSTCGSLPR